MRKIDSLSPEEQKEIAKHYWNEVVSSWGTGLMNEQRATKLEKQSVEWFEKNYQVDDCYFAIIPEEFDNYKRYSLQMELLYLIPAPPTPEDVQVQLREGHAPKTSKKIKSDKIIKKDIYLN